MKVVVSLTTIFDRQKQCVKTLKSLLEIKLYVSSDAFYEYTLN